MRAESIRTTTELLRQADAVLVGAGSGLSSAAGYNHYHHNTVFEENFHDFEKAYGIQSLFQGFYYVYSKPEQQWGFYSRYIKFMEEAPVGQPYIDLLEILREKEYFILTTNCDIQVPKVFPEERTCQFQGDFRYFQCSQPCHDKLSAAGKWFRGCRTVHFYRAKHGKSHIEDMRILSVKIRIKSCSCWN